MATGATQPAPGSPVDIPIAENVISLARWAVDEHNRIGPDNLEFRGVWCAQSQIVEGIRYWFTLAASGGETNKYEAQVLLPAVGERTLEAFNPVPAN